MDERICPSLAVESLDDFLVPYVDDNSKTPKPPGILAAVVRYDSYSGITYTKAVGGYGRRDSRVPANAITKHDQTRIGSCTKSFTAGLVAMAVEQKLIGWNWRLDKLLPELKDVLPLQLKNVTMQMLMNHRSGLKRTFGGSDFTFLPVTTQRTLWAQQLLSDSSNLNGQMWGTALYSNAGYVLAGHILERYTGVQWEQLIRDWIFTPLGFNQGAGGAGFAEVGNGMDFLPSQPFGHQTSAPDASPANMLMPVWAQSSTAPLAAPAGDIHLTQEQHALWVAFNIRMINNPPTTCGSPWVKGCATAAQWQLVHNAAASPPGDSTLYAMGWYPTNPNPPGVWGVKGHIQHNGLIGGWYSLQTGAYSIGLAVTVTTNHVRFENGQPNDVITPVSDALGYKYKLPACRSFYTPQVSNQVRSRADGCQRVSQIKEKYVCSVGPNGYQINNSSASLNSATACSKACLLNDKCLAFHYSAPTCTLIGGNAIPTRGRKLTDVPSIYLPYQCHAATTIMEYGDYGGIMTSAKPGPQTVGVAWTSTSATALNPYNLDASQGAFCASSALECNRICAESRMDDVCATWTFNAATYSCYLYKTQPSTSQQSWTQQAHCAVSSGSVVSQCW